MFNVLPENLKAEIIKEYRIRLAVLCAAAIFCCEIFMLATFLPVAIFSVFQERMLRTEVSSLGASQITIDTNAVFAELEKVNKTLDILGSQMYRPPILGVLNEILKRRGTDINLNHFSFKTNNDSMVINISGHAKNRESLVSFVKNLKQSEVFSSVDLPISDLAGSSDISFAITAKK
jgi:hypothetical protein